MVRIFISKVESKITSEKFIKHIMDKYLGIQQDKLIIDKNKYGKPFFVNYPNIYYNISHTKGAIVCVLSNQPIGIDIERVKKFDKRIVEKFFTKKEHDYIFTKDENQDIRFFEIWTRKEAYVKCLGKGMAIPFGSFDTTDNNRIITIYINDWVISICTDFYNALELH